MPKRTIDHAAAPGYWQMAGRVKKGDGDTFDIPQAALNIGGLGHGYLLAERQNWDPLEEGNHDGTLDGGLGLGDDVFVYAVQPEDGAYAELIASLSSTWPDGYDADTSRRICGGHYGRDRMPEDRYQKDDATVEGIIESSVWDIGNMPKADPSGMREIGSGIWVGIYLASSNGEPWPHTAAVSEFGQQPLNDNDIGRVDFFRYAANAGGRLPTLEEMYEAAYGVPAGNTGEGSRIDTGEHGPYGHHCVSVGGTDQACGNLWSWCSDASDRDSYNSITLGEDSEHDRGEARMRHAVHGGTHSASEAGAFCTHRNSPWTENGLLGFRLACDRRQRP